MMLLISGLLIFFLVHLVPAQPDLKSGLVSRFGNFAYRVTFSVFALIGLTLIVVGFHKLQLMPGKNPIIWSPPDWTRHIAFLLMIPAMILLAATFVPSRIRTAAKHPMLAAIKFWALAHLIANGDLGSMVLFSSFLAFAVVDRIAVKDRPAAGALLPARGGVIND